MFGDILEILFFLALSILVTLHIFSIPIEETQLKQYKVENPAETFKDFEKININSAQSVGNFETGGMAHVIEIENDGEEKIELANFSLGNQKEIEFSTYFKENLEEGENEKSENKLKLKMGESKTLVFEENFKANPSTLNFKIEDTNKKIVFDDKTFYKNPKEISYSNFFFDIFREKDYKAENSNGVSVLKENNLAFLTREVISNASNSFFSFIQSVFSFFIKIIFFIIMPLCFLKIFVNECKNKKYKKVYNEIISKKQELNSLKKMELLSKRQEKLLDFLNSKDFFTGLKKIKNNKEVEDNKYKKIYDFLSKKKEEFSETKKENKNHKIISDFLEMLLI